MAAISNLHEIYPKDRRATAPLGIRVDDLVLADRLDARDPVTGEVEGDLEQQAATCYQKMAALLEGAGGGIDNVGKATAYVGVIEDREPVNGQFWEAVFPIREDRPAYKVLLAKMPPGVLVQLDVVGILGGRRTRIDIPGVPARDPTITIGEMIFSSRCHGVDGATGELVDGGLPAQAAQTFKNLRSLTVAAGGQPSDIVQLNAYGKTEAYAAPTQAAFVAAFADLEHPPVLHTFVNHITARFEISVEMVAVRGGGR